MLSTYESATNKCANSFEKEKGEKKKKEGRRGEEKKRKRRRKGRKRHLTHRRLNMSLKTA